MFDVKIPTIEEVTITIKGEKYRTCPACGKTFKVEKGHTDGICCSSKCRGKIRMLKEAVKRNDYKAYLDKLKELNFNLGEKKEVKVIKEVKREFDFNLGYMICACLKIEVCYWKNMLQLIKEYDEFANITDDIIVWHINKMLEKKVIVKINNNVDFANRNIKYSFSRINTADGFIESILKPMIN